MDMDNHNKEELLENNLNEEKNVNKNEEKEQETQSESKDKKEKKPAEKDPVTLLNEKIQKMEEENRELKDTLLRKQADFENFRKRINKDKEESIKFANQMLLLDITDTIDNFERAIKSAEGSKDFDAFYEGIVLIEKKLVSTLESKWNVTRFNSIGEVFDPDRHQAIAVEDSTEHDKQVVLEDFQKGYLYYDRILRPAKVKVCNPVAGNESVNNNA